MAETNQEAVGRSWPQCLQWVASLSWKCKGAARAEARSCVAGSAGQFEGENAGGHGDDSIAQHHEDGSDEAAEDGVRRDIAVTDGGYGDDGPVHGRGNACETVLLALDLIHHCANQDDDGQYREEEYRDFGKAGAESYFQGGCFAEELRELENAKDAEKAKGANQRERVSDAEKDSEVDGEDSEQVHYAEEADGVTPRIGRAGEARGIFESEEDRDHPFGGLEVRTVGVVKAADAIEENGEDPEKDEDEKGEVEQAAGEGNVAEDDFVKLVPPGSATIDVRVRCGHGFQSTAAGNFRSGYRKAQLVARK